MNSECDLKSNLPARAQRLVLAGLISLAALIGLIGCRGDVTILEVRPINDGPGLEVVLNTCNADVSVDIEEYDDRIVVHAENHDRRLFVTGTDDCTDVVPVDLGTPLGDRRVTDPSGNEFVVRRR